MSEVGTTYKYITRTAHGKYPAGSSCIASFHGRELSLTFEDNCSIILSRNDWYLQDIETRRPSYHAGILDIIEEEDKRFFETVNMIIEKNP